MLARVGIPNFVKLSKQLIRQDLDTFGVRIGFGEFDLPVEGRAKLLTDSKVDDSTQ